MSKKYLFGVKYLIPYDLATLVPKGLFEVLGAVEISREIEKLLLSGGHANSAWGVEAGESVNTIAATIKEYPNFAFEVFENATIVSATDETDGYVGTLANKFGASAVNAVTGILNIVAKVGSEANIPSGFIVVKVKTATTVTLYLAGDVPTGRIPIVSELPVIADDVAIEDTDATIDLVDYGITITSGSGTIAMTIGDTAFVNVRTPNTVRDTIQVGSNSDVNYVGMLLVYPRNAEGEQSIIRFPKVAVAGMPFSANSREFSEFEQSMTPLVDSTEDILYELIKTKVA